MSSQFESRGIDEVENLLPRDFLFPELKSPFHGMPYPYEDPPFGVSFSIVFGLEAEGELLLLLLPGLFNLSDTGEPSEIGISNTHLGDCFPLLVSRLLDEFFISSRGSCSVLLISSYFTRISPENKKINQLDD